MYPRAMAKEKAMKHLLVALIASMAAASLMVVGCTTAPAPAPTKAPVAAPTAAPAAAPTKAPAAAPTVAPTAAPTPVPTPKVSYPEKGKTVTVIVPWSAGASNDIVSRMFAAEIEKDLGVPFQVVNKPGATTQIGMTEIANAKPDGYTIGLNSLQTTISVYLDPERKATFNRNSFQPISTLILDPFVIYVQGDGPYKTTKDLIDAAKAKPESIKVGTNGVMSPSHMSWLLLEKAAGVKFAAVHFDGGAPNMTALLGGHVDASSTTPGGNLDKIRSGQLRALAVFDREKSPMLPDVPAITSQGYNAIMLRTAGWDAPAGTPMPIVEVLGAAIKKVMEMPEIKQKAVDQGITLYPMDAKQYAAHWEEAEKDIKAVLTSLGVIK